MGARVEDPLPTDAEIADAAVQVARLRSEWTGSPRYADARRRMMDLCDRRLRATVGMARHCAAVLILALGFSLVGGLAAAGSLGGPALGGSSGKARPVSAEQIPPLSTGARGDQIMAHALATWAVEGRPPSARAVSIALEHQGEGSTANLAHMRRVIGSRALGVDALRRFYELSLDTPAFRGGEFEAASVGYAGYQDLSAVTVLTAPSGDFPPDLRDRAREYLRRSLTLSAIHATAHGRVAMACGRVYAREPAAGVVSPALDYRVRAVLGITGDGWWPPRGVGRRWWDVSGLTAQPWRLLGALPSWIFSPPEMEALRAWVAARVVRPELLDLVAAVRLPGVWHLVAWPGGHVSWAETLTSYGGGPGSAQPLVQARGDELVFAVREPPTGSRWDGDWWQIGGAPAPRWPAKHGFSAPPPGSTEILIGQDGGRIRPWGAAGALPQAPRPPPAAPVDGEATALAAVRAARAAAAAADDLRPQERQRAVTAALEQLAGDQPQLAGAVAAAARALEATEAEASAGEIRQAERRRRTQAAWDVLEAAAGGGGGGR